MQHNSSFLHLFTEKKKLLYEVLAAVRRLKIFGEISDAMPQSIQFLHILNSADIVTACRIYYRYL